MGSPPSVLLLDDGELDDVHELLQELDVACARVRGGAIVQGTPPPRHLLVATPRRIDAVSEALDTAQDPPLRVMVVQEDSNALRERLRRDGFDYLVRRPVHAEAMRLLMLHCIYRGEERRQERRVAVGRQVEFRCGLSSREATLADLSVRGCRLLADEPVEVGRRLKVPIPPATDADEELPLHGRVARVQAVERDGALLHALGLEFDPVDDAQRKALLARIEHWSRGPARLGADPVPTPEPAAEEPREERPRRRSTRRRPGLRGVVREINAARHVPTPLETAGHAPRADAETGAERRSHRRARYEQKIPAFGNRALRVLVGRDLSVGGMRIDRLEGLDLGDRLHLAVYGKPGEEPLLMWGSIVRDDRDGGMAVAFDPLGAEAELELERMVAELPTVESLHDSEVEAMGSVMAEIVG